MPFDSGLKALQWVVNVRSEIQQDGLNRGPCILINLDLPASRHRCWLPGEIGVGYCWRRSDVYSPVSPISNHNYCISLGCRSVRVSIQVSFSCDSWHNLSEDFLLPFASSVSSCWKVKQQAPQPIDDLISPSVEAQIAKTYNVLSSAHQRCYRPKQVQRLETQSPDQRCLPVL